MVLDYLTTTTTIGADREVQRILLEVLNQMDGFDQSTNVKVIMATNRADTLDPALLRPGMSLPLPLLTGERRVVFMLERNATNSYGMLCYYHY